MFKGSGNVIYLNEKSFTGKRIIKNTIPVRGIIMFGTEWCKFCRQTFPEFQKSAKLLKGTYTFYYVDCEKNKDLLKRFNIQGFPTIKFVDKNGNIYKDYSSDRSVKSFLDEICTESSICKKY